MKKLLFVLALGAFAACGGGTSTESTTDSTATTDTSSMMPADTSTMMPADTTHMSDSTHKDSTK